jgi:hypothetical protein
MLVDYVRHYVPSSVKTQLSQPSAITVKAGATSGNTTEINISQAQGTGRTAFSCSTTAPQASCLVTTDDRVNKYTADFSNASSAAATVTVSTALHTSPGKYSVTVNAYTVSSSDAEVPSASTTFDLIVD